MNTKNLPGTTRGAIRFRPLPWPLRWTAWTLIAIEAVLPVYPQTLALMTQTAPASQTGGLRVAGPPPEPVVTVNRTVPQVEPPSTELRFSAEPTDDEIARARVFSSPIVGLGAGNAQENSDLAQALIAYQGRQDPEDASALENFLQTHPGSPRYISLLASLAAHYRQTSQLTKALESLQQVWALGKDVTDLKVRQVVDQAVGQWASLLVTLGRMVELKTLLQELNGRPLHGVGAVHVSDAGNALWQMEHLPQKTFKCGPYSLSRIQAVLNPSAPFSAEIVDEESTTNGTSLAQNWLLAQRMGLKYQMAKREPGAEIPLPVMMHWKLGHFSAITALRDGLYRIEDPTFVEGWISAKVLDEECDGYFLVPDGPRPPGWSPVSAEEGKTVFGRSWPSSSDTGAGGGDCKSGPPPAGGYGEGSPNTKPCGMPQYTFNMMRVGLEIADVPLGYTPPRGPEIEFRITYSERTIYESGPFSHANLGDQWTYEWLQYISDDTTEPNANVNLVVNNGNSETFTGYNTNSGTYAVQYQGGAQLTKTSGSSYQCLYPDGSQEIYSQPDATNGPRRVFLTRKIDPSSNSLTFTYDSTNRLVSVKDAIGQVTTLSYGLTNDIYKITKVADPFGRFATLQYNTSGQLTNIADEIGISTSFAYGAPTEADFINAMTTPYGVTTFTNTNADFSGRWLVATDPLGGQERAEFTQGPPGVSDQDPANLVPVGLNTNRLDGSNAELAHRMSFFWNKKTMQAMQGTIDYTKARQYVWDRTAANFYCQRQLFFTVSDN